MELRQLTDPELHARLKALAAQERESVADIVEHLAELERRDSVTDTGCGTLFDYCRRVLGYSEAAAFLRIRAARAALISPRVVADLRSGAVHLDAVMRLAPHLNEENGEKLLDLASGATKREVQALVAGFGGETPPAERDHIRVVAAAPALDGASIIPPPSRVRLAFTADDEFLKMVERLRNLRRQRFPEGRLEDILKEAVAAWLSTLTPAARRRPLGRPAETRKRSRRIPAAVRTAVWERDGGRCVFTAPDGTRCGARDFIQYDHIMPWSLGGPSIPSNLRLLCRPHNLRLARLRFKSKVPRRRVRVRPDAPAHAPTPASALSETGDSSTVSGIISPNA